MTGIERLEFLADVLADNEKYGAVAANLREIAAQITADLTDREGYESDVLAWVEEHGGLGRVSAAHERQKRHIDRVERWSAARAGRLKRHIATLEQALTRRNRRIRELDAQRDKSDLTHRAPVFAADGKPLEVGQTVYGVGDGKEFEVVNIRGGMPLLMCRGGEAKYTATEPEYLTNARPVLDADGVPAHEGDTVYLLPGEWCGEYPLLGYSAGDEMVVKELCPGHEVEGVLMCVGVGKFACFPLPYQFTHTKPELPDTWERIEEDVDALVDAEDNGVGSFNAANDYCERHGLENGTVWVMMARDLVRHCREVAERERGE